MTHGDEPPGDEPVVHLPAAGDGRGDQSNRAGDGRILAAVVRPGATPVDRAPQDLPEVPGAADGGASTALAALQRRVPFTELFCTIANRTQPGRGDVERAYTLRTAHPYWYALCCLLDGLLRLVVTALLLAVLAAVAWKTLTPLPALKSG